MTPRDTVTIRPGVASGTVVIPPSKSIAHRALICAALCPRGSVSRLSHMPCNEDIDATVDCLRALGVGIREERTDNHTRVLSVEGCGGEWDCPNEPLYCRESGSTLRFMLPLCLLSEHPRTLTGSERLLARPLEDYDGLLADRPCTKTDDGLALLRGARINGGHFALSGRSSSQFITGLLFVLPLLEEDSVIELAAPPESKSYIDMTIAVLARFGVRAVWESDTRLFVEAKQTYTAHDMRVDGDASGAAFFHALNAMQRADAASDIVCPLSEDIVQGDAICPQLLDQLKNGRDGLMTTISLADCPDLGPILFAAAAAMGGGIFTHTDRLRFKESDRVAAMAEELSKFGVRCDVRDGCEGGKVTVYPHPEGLKTPSGVLHGHNDHRIVMSLCVLAACLPPTASVAIDDAHAVAKSFPDFFDKLRSLGIDCCVN